MIAAPQVLRKWGRSHVSAFWECLSFSFAIDTIRPPKFGILLYAALACAYTIPVTVKEGVFVDAEGRQRFFRGVNVVYKVNG